MEVNNFLLLICSLEKQLLVEWFFNYSTRRQAIVFLSLLVVLFEGNLLEWGQLFSGKILWWGGNFPGGRWFSLGVIILRGNFPWGQLSGAQFSSGQLSVGQLSGGQFSSGAIVLEPSVRYLAWIFKLRDVTVPKLPQSFIQETATYFLF